MATFTMELRELHERKIPLGLDNYPIFDNSYRNVLNEHIIRHYWYREIGFETADMFAFKMDARMRLIMPPINKLYLSTLMKFDPLIGTKLRTTSVGTGKEDATQTTVSSGQSDSVSESTAKSRNVGSDFPQTMLSQDGDYASTASDSVADTEVNSGATESSTGESDSTSTRESESDTLVEGYGSSPASLIMQYRETLINVDMIVISELSDLFMNIWDNGDEMGDYPTNLFPFFWTGAI